MNPKAIEPRKLEDSINRVKGVYASRVVLDGPSEVLEIHVVGSPDRNPKQIVRDIESLIFVNFGVRLDYRRVSLVQVGEERIFPSVGPRPQLVSVSCDTDSPQARVEVQLESDRGLHTGVAEGPVDSADTSRLAALATLHALEQMVGRSNLFHLEGIQETTFGEQNVVVVFISLMFPAVKEALLGTSFVGDALFEACARATLDGVNRRLWAVKYL